MNIATPSPIGDPRLAPLSGGWKLHVVDVGWTQIELAVPVDPDSLLGNAEVLAANQRDDYMPYWATLWPAATKTAAALAWADWPAGTRVLELGCGLGLVGIAGLKRGWSVLMTDYEPLALSAAEFNAQRNGFPDVAMRVLDWRRPYQETFPVILACDVLYEQRSHRPLLNLLQRMLTKGGCCWLADPGRTPLVDFYQSAVADGFSIRLFTEDGTPQSFPVRGQFQLLQLTPPDVPRLAREEPE